MKTLPAGSWRKILVKISRQFVEEVQYFCYSATYSNIKNFHRYLLELNNVRKPYNSTSKGRFDILRISKSWDPMNIIYSCTNHKWLMYSNLFFENCFIKIIVFLLVLVKFTRRWTGCVSLILRFLSMFTPTWPRIQILTSQTWTTSRKWQIFYREFVIENQFNWENTKFGNVLPWHRTRCMYVHITW